MMRLGLFAVLAIFGAASFAAADEAVATNGEKHAGRLVREKGVWSFRTGAGKQIAIAELAYVRFDTRPIPLPKAPLTRTLCLPNEQRVSGTLLKLDEKNIVFVTSWGKSLTLERAQVVGIQQAGDALPILHDDFETDLKSWQVEGKPALDQECAYFGKSSVRLDGARQKLARTWQPGLRDGVVRLFFFDPGESERTCSFEIIADKQLPALAIDASGYSCRNMKQVFGPLKASSGWHLVAVELDAGRLRIYIDDHCLGQSALEAIDGIRIVHGAGKLWIDEFSVTRKVAPMPLPMPGDQDALWLEQGEQIFGRIVAADRDAVSLDAKFGRRSLPWSRLRGILFAQKKQMPPTAEPEITFRPGPGFPLDMLRAKLVRWDGENLIIDHTLLGEIAIARERLETVRFAAK